MKLKLEEKQSCYHVLKEDGEFIVSISKSNNYELLVSNMVGVIFENSDYSWPVYNHDVKDYKDMKTVVEKLGGLLK